VVSNGKCVIRYLIRSGGMWAGLKSFSGTEVFPEGHSGEKKKSSRAGKVKGLPGIRKTKNTLGNPPEKLAL